MENNNPKRYVTEIKSLERGVNTSSRDEQVSIFLENHFINNLDFKYLVRRLQHKYLSNGKKSICNADLIGQLYWFHSDPVR